LKHIRVSVGRVYKVWGLSATGTFLTQDEIDSIRSRIKAVDDQVALPEIASFPAGGIITLTLFGEINPTTTATAAVEAADVTIVEVVPLVDNWFLQLYRSPFIAGVGYAILFGIAVPILSWALPRLLSKTEAQADDTPSKK